MNDFFCCQIFTKSSLRNAPFLAETEGPTMASINMKPKLKMSSSIFVICLEKQQEFTKYMQENYRTCSMSYVLR